jgi:hypothetical protein
MALMSRERYGSADDSAKCGVSCLKVPVVRLQPREPALYPISNRHV